MKQFKKPLAGLAIALLLAASLSPTAWADIKTYYNAALVAITGGSINGTTVGASTASTGAFTTLSSTSGLVLPTVENAITAHSGGGQGSAFALSATATFHRISTVAVSADSVVLPLATPGAWHYIYNAGANPTQVFGTSPDTINAVATGTGVQLSTLTGAVFYATATGGWTSTQTAFSGSGNGVRQTSPFFTTPTLGVAAGTSLTNTGTLTAGGTTLNVSPAAQFQVNGSSGAYFVRTNGIELYNTFAGDFYFGGIGAGSKGHMYANNADIFDFGATGIYNGTSGNLLVGIAAPTISSGFGSSPSIVSSNGSTTFRLNVGTGASATGGIVGLPTAATGWNCSIDVLNPTATNLLSKTVVTSSNTTTVTVSNELLSTGSATAWPASTVLMFNCFAY